MGTTASHHSGSRYFENLNCEITWSHSALQGIILPIIIQINK